MERCFNIFSIFEDILNYWNIFNYLRISSNELKTSSIIWGYILLNWRHLQLFEDIFNSIKDISKYLKIFSNNWRNLQIIEYMLKLRSMYYKLNSYQPLSLSITGLTFQFGCTVCWLGDEESHRRPVKRACKGTHSKTGGLWLCGRHRNALIYSEGHSGKDKQSRPNYMQLWTRNPSQ